jgi:hypothetical protein
MLRKSTALLAVAFTVTAFLSGCVMKPRVSILDKKIESKIYRDDEGSLDAGFQIRYRLKNTGSPGTVSLKIRLITDQGSLDRERSVFLLKGEVQQVTFDCPEFTWTAHDAQVFEQIEL